MRAACLLSLCTCAIAGADDGARDRNARAALALAGTRPAPAAAPAPRPAPQDYAAGYRAASESQQPLVVFVGASARQVPGAVVARTDQFADLAAPAVVVGYPSGGALLVHETLAGSVDPERLERAVQHAAKKIGAPGKDARAPKPLNWSF